MPSQNSIPTSSHLPSMTHKAWCDLTPSGSPTSCPTTPSLFSYATRGHAGLYAICTADQARSHLEAFMSAFPTGSGHWLNALIRDPLRAGSPRPPGPGSSIASADGPFLTMHMLSLCIPVLMLLLSLISSKALITIRSYPFLICARCLSLSLEYNPQVGRNPVHLGHHFVPRIQIKAWHL